MGQVASSDSLSRLCLERDISGMCRLSPNLDSHDAGSRSDGPIRPATTDPTAKLLDARNVRILESARRGGLNFLSSNMGKGLF